MFHGKSMKSTIQVTETTIMEMVANMMGVVCILQEKPKANGENY